MASSLARSAYNATTVLHSLIYFAPEAEQQFTGVGLKPGQMGYFASRAAPMGAVGSGVVTATFYNFSPRLVASAIPEAWELASPEVVIGARFAAVDAALTRLLGPDVIASDDMITLAALVRDAAGACTPEGRPLYAGHADLDWPEAPHLVMWHALTLLREHRGDGHIAALNSAGLSGIEALVTHSASGKGFLAAFAQASRGWSQQEWDATVSELAARDLVVDECALTEAGQALRARIEEDTDRMAVAPWEYLGGQRTEEVIRIGKVMSRTVLKAGAIPRAGVLRTP